MHVVMNGTLKPDGTLELDARPSLPSGRVKVTVEAIDRSTSHPDALATLQQIWAERKALNLPSRSQQEIDAEIASMRDEWEQRQRILDELCSEVDQP